LIWNRHSRGIEEATTIKPGKMSPQPAVDAFRPELRLGCSGSIKRLRRRALVGYVAEVCTVIDPLRAVKLAQARAKLGSLPAAGCPGAGEVRMRVSSDRRCGLVTARPVPCANQVETV
jgi:hypothetical protein